MWLIPLGSHYFQGKEGHFDLSLSLSIKSLLFIVILTRNYSDLYRYEHFILQMRFLWNCTVAYVEATPILQRLRDETCLLDQPRKWIERFRPRDRQPCWFTETKEDFCINMEFNSQRSGLVHQYGRRAFFFFETPLWPLWSHLVTSKLSIFACQSQNSSWILARMSLLRRVTTDKPRSQYFLAFQLATWRRKGWLS